MEIKKSDPNSLIKLQNGEYCHITDQFLVINETLNFDKNKINQDQINLSKTKNWKNVRLTINVIFTLAIFSFSIYTQFYPLALLLFVAIWDIRQLKRYQLPINKTKVIPLKNITTVAIKRGQLGLNYMDVFLENQGVKSFIPLKLYDSESTLEQAKQIIQNLGKLTESPANETSKISGPSFSINEISAYVLQDEKWHYIEHGIFDKSRTDNYLYLRSFSYFLIALGISMIGIKIYLIFTNPSNWIDFSVLVLLSALLVVPYKYISKALPNVFSQKEIIDIQQNKKKHFIILKSKWGKNLKIHIKNRFIPKDFNEMLNSQR